MASNDPYVPETVGELRDYFGYVSLCAPDKFPDGATMDEAYEIITMGLNLLRKRIGEDRYTRLIEMLEQSKQHFLDGEDRAGAVILANMKDVISGREPEWE